MCLGGRETNNQLAISLARVEAERDALREQLEQIKEDRDHWRRLAEQHYAAHKNSWLSSLRLIIFRDHKTGGPNSGV